MQRFKSILLVYPCDNATLERATSLARANHAKLTLLRVERELTGTSLITSPGSPALQLQDLVIKEYQSQLKDIIAPVKKEGVRVSAKVVIGTPFLEIIRDVILTKHDLVIMTAEGMGGLKERLFGSTSLHLMRKCPCPVWVMKPSKPKQFLRVMAAVDPEPFEDSSDELNVFILKLAAAVAAKDGAELHVVHAWALFGESIIQGRTRLTDPEISGYIQEETGRHQELLDALVSRHTDGSAVVHMVKGLAESVIVEMAKSEKVDLLVMGTVCRTGIPGFFIGNTAEKILDEVDCSVLTVKPATFQSPVKFD
ncbi:universal stress protein [Aporhodopirellula aestuarii]|uniref:Universal stress protein n=1 Tax=Aporhodopirellula aestuarii TaxID=2950107 RepID=A0ABT0U7K1_9BACT|nr:universal stress protein [Aporhodopirellula aestuarii]MCM2372856.1 universal stress protein [Aporhodopirellula aestuarii]